MGFTWIFIMVLWIYGTVKLEHTLCKVESEQSLNIWLFVKKISPSFITSFEKENQCCGWFGVFDHCNSQNREAIIMESVETQALNDIQNSLDMGMMDKSFDDSMDDIFKGMNKTDSSYSDETVNYGSYDYSDSDGRYYLDPSNNRDSSLSICDPDFNKSEFLFYWNRNCTEDKTVSQVCSKDVCHIHNCSRNEDLKLIF